MDKTIVNSVASQTNRCLQEVKTAVLGAGIRTDAPLADSIKMFSVGIHLGAAPGASMMFSTIDPFGTSIVGHSLELEGEDTLLSN